MVWNVKWHLSINDIEELVLIPRKFFATIFQWFTSEIDWAGVYYILKSDPATTLLLPINVLLVTSRRLLMPTQKFKRIMRATQGALIVASTLQIVLGFSGLWRNVTRLVQNQN